MTLWHIAGTFERPISLSTASIKHPLPPQGPQNSSSQGLCLILSTNPKLLHHNLYPLLIKSLHEKIYLQHTSKSKKISWFCPSPTKTLLKPLMCLLSCFSHVWLIVTPWTVAHRLLHPWDSPGKNIGVGCHALLQEIFPTQRSNPGLICRLHWQAGSLLQAPPVKLCLHTVTSKPIFTLSRGCSANVWEESAFDVINITNLKTSLSYGVISVLCSSAMSSERPQYNLDIQSKIMPSGHFHPQVLISWSSEPLSLFVTLINTHLLISYILIPLLEGKIQEDKDAVLFPNVSSLYWLKKKKKKKFTMWELQVRCWVHAFSVPLFVSDSFETPWTVAHQVPLSMGFSRLEYWSGWPCPPPGDLPDPGIERASLISHALAEEFFITCTTWEDWVRCYLGANEDWSLETAFLIAMINCSKDVCVRGVSIYVILMNRNTCNQALNFPKGVC